MDQATANKNGATRRDSRTLANRVAERLHVETLFEKTLPPVGSPALPRVQGRGGEAADVHRWPGLYDLHSTPDRSNSLARDNAGTRYPAPVRRGRSSTAGDDTETTGSPRRETRRKRRWKQDRGPGRSTPEGWRTAARRGAGGLRPPQQRCSRCWWRDPGSPTPRRLSGKRRSQSRLWGTEWGTAAVRAWEA